MSTISIANRKVSGATGGKSLDDAEQVAVLVHGAAMDRTVWSMQTRWLAHHGCPVLAIDLPGHGASTEARLDSVRAYADWLLGVVADIDRPVHLVGHSMGSFVSLEAATDPSVASVTLFGVAAAMPVHPALLDAAEANDPLAAQLMCGWAFAPANRTGAHPSPGSSMVGATQALIGRAADGVLHADLAMCADYSTAEASASSVRCPAQLVLGQVDRMTPVKAAQPLIAAFTDPTVTVVPGCGHMIQVEAPVESRQAIADSMRSA